MLGINRNWKPETRNLPGFTLIELLIVVAIIAILAAIAIPNFLLAQTRSKVSRVSSELRNHITALESYFVDNNDYPESHTMIDLTTPISYITSLPNDVFGKPELYLDPYTRKPIYIWVKRTDTWKGVYDKRWGCVMSWGPGSNYVGNYTDAAWYWTVSDGCEYDPSNGTVSIGRIFRLVPGNLPQSGNGF